MHAYDELVELNLRTLTQFISRRTSCLSESILEGDSSTTRRYATPRPRHNRGSLPVNPSPSSVLSLISRRITHTGSELFGTKLKHFSPASVSVSFVSVTASGTSKGRSNEPCVLNAFRKSSLLVLWYISSRHSTYNQAQVSEYSHSEGAWNLQEKLHCVGSILLKPRLSHLALT